MSLPMNETRRQWVVIAFLAAALSANAAQTNEAAKSPTLPKGWIFLEKEGIDSIAGAYHDSVSGLFVRTEVAFQSVVIPWAQTIAKKRGATVQRTEKDDQTVLLATAPTERRPCDEQVISILRKEDSWNLGATLCNNTQRERFVELSRLLQTVHADWPGSMASARKALRASDIHQVAPGMSWSDVLGRLGQSIYAQGEHQGAFAVNYEAESKRVTLHFNREQLLVAVQWP